MSTKPPDLYYRPRHALSSEAGHDEVVGIIREHEISLVILDSLSIGMGADATSQQDVTRIMQRFKDWGTVFAIDHISGQAARGVMVASLSPIRRRSSSRSESICRPRKTPSDMPK